MEIKAKLLLIVGISIFAIISIATPLYLNFTTFDRTNSQITIQTEGEITYTKSLKEVNPVLIPLKKIPNNLGDTFQKLAITPSQANKVKMLKYGVDIVGDSDESVLNLPLAYQELSIKGVPIFLNNQSIDLYFKKALSDVQKEITDKVLIKQLKYTFELNPFDLDFKSFINVIFNLNRYIKIKTEVTKVLKRVDTQDYVLTISQLNSISKEDIDFLQTSFKTSQFIDGVNYINKTNVLFNIPQLFVTPSEQSKISTLDYEYLKGVNAFQSNISENNSKILDMKELFVSVPYTNIEINSHIYYEKNVNQLQKYIDITNHYVQNLGEMISPNDITKPQDLLNTLTALKNGADQERLRAIIYSLPNVHVPNDYLVKYELMAFQQGGNYQIATSPIVFKSTYDVKISNNNFNDKYDTKVKGQRSGSIRIPVLMYHHIAEIPKNAKASVQSMYITPEVFEQQLAYLLANNYKTLSMEEFLEILETGKNPKQKSVLLTFDDGKSNHYTSAFPLLKKYSMKGTFFIPSQRSAVKSNQLKEMAQAGMSMESHRVTHPNLVNIPDYSEVAYQVGSSKAQIQYITGKPVISIAFPGCMWDTRTMNAMAGAGYKLGFSCGKTIDHYYSHKYVLSRIHVNNELTTFKWILSGKLDY